MNQSRVDKTYLALAAIALVTIPIGAVQASADNGEPDPMDQQMAATAHKLEEMAPYRGYLKAHDSVQRPMEILGGPLHVELVNQRAGGTWLGQPQRTLDPQVFSTPDKPRKRNGFPIVTGVPAALRRIQYDRYTQLKKRSPFGDESPVMADGRLQVQATDATATDAAKARTRPR